MEMDLGLIVLCALLVGALLWREQQHGRHIVERERTWDLERGSLLTRIQHPEVIPVPRPVEVNGEELVPDHGDPEPQDDIDLVGTVVDGALDG